MMESASVIIPTYNQASRLALTLHSLCHQREIDDCALEVVVVDDGSTDETPAVLAQFVEKLPLKYIHQPNQGRAVARNTGISTSTGAILLFTDSDRLLSNYWVKSHCIFQQNHPCRVGIGEIREFYFSALEKYVPVLVEAMEINFASLSRLSRPFSYWEFVKKTLDKSGCSQIGAPWIMTLTGNLSVRRYLIDEVGGFDRNLSGWGFEHFELGYRLHKEGSSFWHVTNATNYHLAHARPAKFYDEYMQASLKQIQSRTTDPAWEALWPLLHGQLSLGEFDEIATLGTSRLVPEVRAARFSPPLC